MLLDALTPANVFLALVGGILPALLWLWFWLKEDALHPEPRRMIMLAFLTGMLATVISYPLELVVDGFLPSYNAEKFLLWAMIEESLKWMGIMILLLRSDEFDEPIDAVMYTVTGALGFAALENAMFLLAPLANGDNIMALHIENFRFIGATLLHVAASAIPGLLIAHTFYKRQSRIMIGFYGLLGAIILHTTFNVSIMHSDGRYIYLVFIGLWGVILGILYACEKVKRMQPGIHASEDDVFPMMSIKIMPRHTPATH